MSLLNLSPMENTNAKKHTPTFTVRYAGDYSSRQLFGRYGDLESAQAAAREGKRVALENGNAAVAKSIAIYAN